MDVQNLSQEIVRRGAIRTERIPLDDPAITFGWVIETTGDLRYTSLTTPLYTIKITGLPYSNPPSPEQISFLKDGVSVNEIPHSIAKTAITYLPLPADPLVAAACAGAVVAAILVIHARFSHFR